MNPQEKRRARFVLRGLENTGQPPQWGARLINVGTDHHLKYLKEEFLEDALLPLEGMDGGGGCQWIEAEYGNGKTQFLRCVQEMAWEKGFVTAFVELSQNECPLDRPDLIFSAIARAIQPPVTEIGDVDKSRGLDSTILQLVERKFPGGLAGDGQAYEMLSAWISQVNAIPTESTAVVTAIVSLLRAVIGGNEEKSTIARMYLKGEKVPAKELRSIGVHEKLDKTSGFRVLRSVCQFLQRSQLANGVLLLFDEAQRTLSLMTSKTQKKVCEHLLAIINKCNSGEFPGTLFLYAVMPEFFTDFATAYPALQQRCSPRTRIPLDRLNTIEEDDLLVEIGRKITSLFGSAYESDFDEAVLESNLQLLARACISASMGTGTRRQMVQSLVALLKDSQRHGRLPQLNEQDAEDYVEGAVRYWEELEAQAVENEGE